MEYLERLGLVPRKSKKVRESSPLPRRCAAGLTRAIETDTTCASSEPTSSSTALADIARLPIPASSPTTTAATGGACFYPRRRSSACDEEPFVDVDYLEYEQHVQAQAAKARRAQSRPSDGSVGHFGSPFGSRIRASGGRHAWKALIFWRRRRSAIGAAARSASVASAASTPAGSRDRTPNRGAFAGHERRLQAGIPLYYCCSDGVDEAAAAAVMMRAWYEPVARTARLLHDSDELCNRSPYVALPGARARLKTPPGAASPGPLYLV